MKRFITFLLALMLITLGASAQSSWTAPQPTTSSLTSGNQYYIYNVGANGFLVNGNSYLTQASVGSQGLITTVTSADEGWTIMFASVVGTYGSHTNCYLYYSTGDSGGKLWCDQDELAATGYFTIAAVSGQENTYTIVSTQAEDTYVGCEEEGTVVSPVIEEVGANTYWQFIAPDNYNAYLAKIDLYDVLVEAEELGKTDLEAYKNAGDVYTSTTATVAEIEAAMVALELAMDVDSDYHTGEEVTVNGISYKLLTDNAIPNHSFELGFEGWTNASDFTTEITSPNFELRSGDAQDGEVYLVGTVNGGSNAASSLGTAWAIETGKTYYFSYWIKNLDGTTETKYLVTSLTNTPGTETSELGYPSSVSSDWQKVEYLFTNPGYDYVQVKFRWLENHWGFDNFQLYEVEPSEDVLDDCDYEIGGEVTVKGKVYEVVSDNMFVNGGFNNSVGGWTAGNSYTNPLAADAVTITETGGYNDGQYITLPKSVGASNAATPTQAIAVEAGKTYLFVGYTSGSAPTEGNLRYSALFEMDWDDKAGIIVEKSHTEDGTSYSNTIIQLEWGEDGWTKTEGVFTVPTEDEESTYGTYSYVGMRMNWSEGSYDGFQLYEVEAVPSSIDWEMTDAGWGTMILPFAADVPEGLTMYAGSALSLDEDESTITVGDAADAIEANTPYLVSGAEGTYTFTGVATNTQDSYQVGMLVGTLVDLSQEEGTLSTNGTQYVLQYHVNATTGEEEDDGLAFYPITSSSTGVTLDAYHCYLTGVTGTSLHLPGMATAIEAVESDVIADDAIYDLSGRRVAKAVKGVYIMNGKKVLVK